MNGSDPFPVDEQSRDTSAVMGRLSHITPIAQLMVTLGIALVMYMIVGLGTDMIIRDVYGVSSGDMVKDMGSFLGEHGDNLNFYRLMQILSTILIFGFSAILSSRLFTGKWLGIFEFSKKSKMSSMLYIPVIIILVFPVISLIYFYLSQLPVPESLAKMEESLELFTLAMLSDENTYIFLINFLMIAILPSIFEEMLFRGVIQRLMIKSFNSAHVGILLSGLLFGFIHGQVFKFLPIAVLGILLGYLYWWTKNLWFPIIAHFFNNGIQVILYFLVAKGWIEMDLESPEMLPPFQSALFAVLFVGVMYLFYNANRKTADEPI